MSAERKMDTFLSNSEGLQKRYRAQKIAFIFQIGGITGICNYPSTST